MKAFKQINLIREKKLVYSYATILSLIGCMIFLSPVFAQQPDSSDLVPRTRVEVHKDFDEHGNLQRYDSTWSRSWSFGDVDQDLFDSLFSHKFNGDFNFNPWMPAGKDSTLLSPFGFNEDVFSGFQFPFDAFDFNNLDSLNFEFFDPSQFNHDFGFDSAFNQAFFDHYNQMLERMEKFRAEHRNLLEQYLGKPIDKEELEAIEQKNDRDIYQNNIPIDGQI